MSAYRLNCLRDTKRRHEEYGYCYGPLTGAWITPDCELSVDLKGKGVYSSYSSSYYLNMRQRLKAVVKPLFFRVSSIIGSHHGNEYGVCSVCGKYSRFRYYRMLTTESAVSKSCTWDQAFVHHINETNTRNCSYCGSKFRIRAASSSLLRLLNPQPSSIHALVRELRLGTTSLCILETSSSDGIFTSFERPIPGVTFSEYFDAVPQGQFVNGVQCQDLQQLTLLDASLDLLISLDVLEHVPNLAQALGEIERVLKPGGHAIVTVPVDTRLSNSRSRAIRETSGIKNLLPPAYHIDPNRKEGVLVYRDFGRDVAEQFLVDGVTVSIDDYATMQPEIPYQKVIIITAGNT